MNKPIKIIDLFAGPGGLGEGFSSVVSGSNPVFKIVASVEKEASAHKTLTLRAFVRQFRKKEIPDEYYQYIRGSVGIEVLQENHKKQWLAAKKETLGGPTALGEDNDVIHEAISEALGSNIDRWVLIGGPPCQAYSLAGRARNNNSNNYVAEKDERHFLYKEYLEIIKKFKPAVFVMENVKGILSSSPTGRPIFEQILGDLKSPCKDLGYNIYSLSNAPRSQDLFEPIYEGKDFTIKSENYGIPQARHRVILLGVRADIDVNPSDVILGKSEAVNVEQALACMPKLRSGLSKEKDTFDNWEKIVRRAHKEALSLLGDKTTKLTSAKLPESRGKVFVGKMNTLSSALPGELKEWLSDKNLGGIIQHETRGHMSSDLARYVYVSLFGKYKKRSPIISEFPKHLLPNHKNIHSGKFVDRFKSQLAGSPSKTITSHISKDSHAFIHFDPVQSRGLTVREAARLQTFPENYFFEGNRTQQYVQVGNAVPPFLANQIGKVVYKLMKDFI
jgi:DNA (cytosine-5)-methyltransferase 1